MLIAAHRTAYLGLMSLFWGVAAGCLPSAAAELVLYTRKGCVYCALWEREIGVIYPRTDEAAKAPLRRVRTDQPQADDPVVSPRVDATPTFILMDEGREIGRFSGYTHDEAFWSRLDVLMRRLDSAPQPTRLIVAE